MSLDLRQDFGHPVHIRLAADEADVRKGLRLGGQMLAAAKADFEPDVVERPVEDFRQRRRRGRGNVQRQPRQQAVDQIGLVGAQSVTLAPAEERALPVRMLAVGIGGTHHRSVWNSRCNSRARGAIEEM